MTSTQLQNALTSIATMLLISIQALLYTSFFALATSQSIDPSSVPLSTRNGWCTNQIASCPLLCTQIGGTTLPTSNSCDPQSLDFSCICSNGMQPNVSQYSQTIPYFECTEAANQCVHNCGSGDNGCATTCRTAHPCGAQYPIRVNLSTVTTSMASATPSASGSNVPADQTGFGGPGGPVATGTSAGNKLRSPSFFHSAEALGFLSMMIAFFTGFAVFL